MTRIYGKSPRQAFHHARVELLRRYVSTTAPLRRFRTRRRSWIEAGIWAAVIVFGWLSLNPLGSFLQGKVSQGAFESLQTVIITVGGAMIGATAILASFVLFAMQVNVERLPHGLFRRFSSDARLLATFGASFVFSIAGTALSLIQDTRFAPLMIVLGLGAVVVILRLLFGAFRRSLVLVNPIEQMRLVREAAERQMQIFERRLSWTMPFAADQHASETDQSGDDSAADEPQFDAPRATVLEANRGWDRVLRNAISHAISYARRAGEDRDTEVSGSALSTIVALNLVYIRVKGRTFHANVPLFADSLSTDGFINESLEGLRRLREAAIARKDEQQAEQIFRTYLALVEVYSGIQYGGLTPSKSHALLAAGYLERSVQAAVRLGLVDTAMVGLGALGDAGRSFLNGGDVPSMTSMVKTIGLIGSAGALRDDFKPLTLTAMEQLSDLTFTLLRTNTADVRFAAGEIRNAVQQISRLFLELPDTPLSSTHSFYLGPYFSSTSLTSLRPKLTILVNALLGAEPADEGAQMIANNFEEWADEQYRGTKELLLLAIEKRSQFVFDLIHWITGVSEILITVAQAPATGEHSRDELRKHASWLFNSLSWIPRDRETASWIEHFSFLESLFEFAIKCVQRDFQQGFDDAWELLLGWGFEAGREHTGWGTLQRALTALIALAVWRGEGQEDLLKGQIRRALNNDSRPSQEVLDRAARDLREKAETVQTREFELRSIERILARNDREATRTLLRDVANILSPGTADEPVRPFF